MKHASLGLGNSTKRTRKRELLAKVERTVPWVSLVEPAAPFEGHREMETESPKRRRET